MRSGSPEPMSLILRPVGCRPTICAPQPKAQNGYNDYAFYPGPMFHLTFNPETGNSGEALWGLPCDVSTFALYINLDLINEAGAPDPRELEAAGEWDWDALMEASESVSALGPDIKGYGGSAWWGPYGVWMNAAGGGFFNADRTAWGLDTAESLEGLTFAKTLYTETDYAVPYGEDAEPPFRAGNVAMFQNGRWATPGIRTAEFDGTLLACRLAPPVHPATGCSGAPMWSMQKPNIRKKPGHWFRL